MRQPTRRRYLITSGLAATIGLSGCTGNSEDDSGADNSNKQSKTQTSTNTSTERTDAAAATSSTMQESSETTPLSKVIVDDRFTLTEGSFNSYDFSVSSKTTVEYNFTVGNGVKIDTYLVTLDEYQNYEGGRMFRSIAASRGSDADTKEIEINRGNYYLIIDHTNMGSVTPPDPIDQVSAEVKIRATYSPNN